MHNSSSLRERSIAQTLEIAKPIARRLGVSRLVNITHLDRIGLPVFASIRPTAASGHLCVNAGKGVSVAEAAVGALMEAIEYAFAEPGASDLSFEIVEIAKLESSFPQPMSVAQFCPIWGQSIAQHRKIAVVPGHVIETGANVLLPAELIWMPVRDLPGVGLFGGSTNGLASGNTEQEACIHALSELIERDTTALNYAKPRSRLVPLESLPMEISQITNSIQGAGLSLFLRHTEAIGRLPYFEAYISEPQPNVPIAISAGYGLHLSKSIAATRAITEAAQARLSHIHGGRDDIVKRHQMFTKARSGEEVRANNSLKERVQNNTKMVDFSNIPDFSDCCHNLADAWLALLAVVRGAELGSPLIVRLTPKGFPLSVVRILVPGLEQFDPESHRAGRRLLQALANE